MKCSIQDCPGSYEPKAIVHTMHYRGETVIIENVPAEVCSVCGDVLLSPETVRQIERLLRAAPPPARMVPLYEYA